MKCQVLFSLRNNNNRMMSATILISTLSDKVCIAYGLLQCLALDVKFSADDILKYFFYFSQKTGFDISCKLSPVETICMKYQILFSGKYKKNINNLLLAEY